MNDDLNVPLIIRIHQEALKHPRPLPPRPTWESSVADMRYGVWVPTESGWTWWQRLANRVMEGSPRLLTPFWGWHRYGS